jgi:hypothetical protein
MWTYSQSKGEWRGVDGGLVSIGYSGCGECKNNPECQEIKNKGPIPRGMWQIIALFDSPSHGPYCLRLAPKDPASVFGRGGFLIHGDSAKFPGEASMGCIILPRKIREYIWQSQDIDLEVTV